MTSKLGRLQTQVAEQMYQAYLASVRRKKAPRLSWLSKDQVYERVAAIFEARNPAETVADVASCHSLEGLREIASEAGVEFKWDDGKRELARKLLRISHP